MLSSDQRWSSAGFAKSCGKAALMLVLTTTLAACTDSSGFRPLYGPTATGSTVQAKMAAVEVATIPSRVGQRIRNELIFQNTGGGEAAPRQYQLKIGIKESLNSGLVTATGDSLTQTYNLQAMFTLIRMKDKKVLLTGTSYANASFERFQQIYSNVRAKEDAENRAAGTVADDIRTRIGIALSREKT
ncbi:MAG: hypothetical protein ACK5JT_23490 [Hyphomicrobiaceae bacterium]